MPDRVRARSARRGAAWRGRLTDGLRQRCPRGPSGSIGGSAGEGAMARKSAGLLMFRRRPGGRVEVLLAHPGGPFWARKDEGAWSLPKGEYGESEEPLEAAKREFAEETGFPVSGPFLALGTTKQ